MVKFKFERERPENTLKGIIETGAQKLKRLIIQENFRLDDNVKNQLDALVLDLEDKHKMEINSSGILKKALEMLYNERGALPEKLEKEYVELIVKEVADAVIAGQELYETLGKEMVELKRQGINIDGKKVEEKVRKIIQ